MSVQPALSSCVNPIYLFDFDGVLCDSAIETAMTGWKAAQTLWSDMQALSLPKHLIEQFRFVRPLLETGYEAILIMRLLHQGQTSTEICQSYQQTMQALIHAEHLNIAQLKQLFGQTRDQWIEVNPNDWLANNPLFAGIALQLQILSERIGQEWYIVTTKQERFVKQILHANGIELVDSHIFGMDQPLTKQRVLQEALEKYPNTSLVFIEDRLQTLLDICENPALQSVSLQLVTWGYNTLEEQAIAQHYPIQLIELADFLQQS
jgi:phosphoglycolate phosphatase-like HAD superfamily hydrolase